jgi:hypothetical protein
MKTYTETELPDEAFKNVIICSEFTGLYIGYYDDDCLRWYYRSVRGVKPTNFNFVWMYKPEKLKVS